MWVIGGQIPEGCDTNKVIVDSVGTTVINDSTYRWVSVSRVAGSAYGLEGKIVERIGAAENYLFPTYISCDTGIFDGSVIYYFSCFEDKAFPLYNPAPWDCEHYKTSGLVENRNELYVKIYPNPATEKLHIKLTEPKGCYQVQIFDATGKKFTNRSIGPGEEVVDISSLPKGIYFVRVTDENGNFYSQKVMKM